MKKRLLPLLLALTLLFGCLPAQVLAAEAAEAPALLPESEDTSVLPAEAEAAPALLDEAGGSFVFSAETDTELVVSPRSIPYTAGETIRSALERAGITLGFDGNDGFVNAINGVEGGYTYASVPERTLTDTADGTVCFRFRGASASESISQNAQALMQVMADYLAEAPDVQKAAAEEYQAALNAYCGISDSDAADYAETLQDAIDSYKSGLDTRYDVRVTPSESGCEITAENAYGLVFTAENGVLKLPVGRYTITASKDGREASCVQLISGAAEISGLTLPTDSWLDVSAFELSSTNDNDAAFADGVFQLERTAASVTANVPDAFAGRLYAYVKRTASAPAGAALSVSYTTASGSEYDEAFVEKSRISSLPDVLGQGTEGNTVSFLLKLDTSTCTQATRLTVNLKRLPTLSALTVTAKSGSTSKEIVQAAEEGAFSALQNTYTYKILNTVSTISLCPTARDGYTIRVNGVEAASGQSVPVTLNGETTTTVTVSAGSCVNEYKLTFKPGEGRRITFNMASGIDLTVTNAAGEVLDYDSERGTASKSYFYTLVDGETYTYVATKDTYYHAKSTLKLTESSSAVINVSMNRQNDLTSLSLGSSAVVDNSMPYTLTPAFSAGTHSYTILVPDSKYIIAAWVTADAGTCTAEYTAVTSDTTHGTKKSATVSFRTVSEDRGVSLRQAVMQGSAVGNTLTFRLTETVSGITYYTDYVVDVQRSLSLATLTAECSGAGIPLVQKGSQSKGYDGTVTEYTLSVPSAATELKLTYTLLDTLAYGETDSGYAVTMNGETAKAGAFLAELDGTEQTQVVELTVTNERYAPEQKTVIRLTVEKQKSTHIKAAATPNGALVFLRDHTSGRQVQKDEAGQFLLSEGFVYDYLVTKTGYVGQRGALRLTASGKLEFGTVLKDGTFEAASSQDAASGLSFQLTAAVPNTSLKTNLDAQWADFRGAAYQDGKLVGTGTTNNSVIDTPTPIESEDGMLYWATLIGDGYGNDAVGCPILAGDAIITYSGKTIYRVDPDTGEVLNQGQMESNSSFSIVPPTYSDGMVFVGLKDGTVQAFDAVTLESLWVYHDPLGGQPNCPITVKDGYLYAGFWNGEAKPANYVCLPIQDEDPTDTAEEKTAAWTYVHDGGFYWAGAYVGDGFVLVGGDDGYSSYTHTTGQLLLLDAATGERLDAADGILGDVRSTVCYDTVSDAYYCTSKGGDFCRAKVGKENGVWKITDFSMLRLDNGTAAAPMSTSTPVIYKGRAYVGVCGSSQFGMYSGHNITVVDLTGDEMAIAYSVPTMGYPQTSGILTTAYEDASEYVYVYFIENYTPGTLRLLRDHAGQTEADLLTSETEPKSGKTYKTAYTLFTPAGENGEHAQYAICSPIVDQYGTLYFKNDSGYLMAFGSVIDHFETTGAAKTEYREGEEFDLGDLKVEAVYRNGVRRDVTALLTPSDETMTAGLDSVTLYVVSNQTLYHNVQSANGAESTVGQEIVYPTLKISVHVAAAGMPEHSYDAESGTFAVTGEIPEDQSLIVACYDENGRLTQVKVLHSAQTVKLNQDSASIRLFLTGTGERPACTSELLKG